MAVKDYVVASIIAYFLLGVSRVARDYNEPPVNRPAYLWEPNPLILILVVLIWPVLTWMDIWVWWRMRLRVRIFGQIIFIGGVFLWTLVAYYIAGFITSSLIPRVIITIPLILLIYYVINKILLLF